MSNKDMMQVITGKYRAKKLIAPNEETTRPTLQRAKETMFNMLPHNLSGKTALDIFAGSGQLGLEAISRGIAFCYFNELDAAANKVLKTNLSTINKTEWTTYALDYKELVKKLSEVKFDLILIDPPYPIAIESLAFLLEFINKNDMLAPGGLITGEAPKEWRVKKDFSSFKLKKLKEFSKITRIWQYEKK